MLVLSESSKIPLYAQLYEQIKADIASGALRAGAKLKSSRNASAELHISRNTVELAYGQLFAEGFITTKPRKGYFVENLGNAGSAGALEADAGAPATSGAPAAQMPAQAAAHDFRCGKLLLSELPCNLWQRLTSRCFHDYREDLAKQGDVFGEAGLRAEIQKHIHACRGAVCSAEQIVIAPGTQFCLSIACQLLKSMGKGLGVAMEEPGCSHSRVTFQNNGFGISPVELDCGGLAVGALAQENVAAACVTPSHQSPTGIVMPVSRREELAEWAAQKGAFIIEDDYNCHFQHSIRPLPSIQSLCAERVFYIGSFSDAMLPCIRISYMVVPKSLLGRLHGWFDGHAPFVPFLAQKPMELFMREGHWESHLRKMGKIQKAKCAALVNALECKFGDRVQVSGLHSGLHVLVRARWPMGEDELISRACRAGVGVYPTSKYWSRPKSGGCGTVLLNYGGIALNDIPGAVGLLHEAWLGK
ncbi:MAG: PLP-dependent aminotransferase family protein [Clostridiales bacterium]|jgi:GntR family transcriptional regulator/MocR family aminotransferase|nr:PLP-dependent aminotransferase family protein [Clostridiales bacterium]